MNNYFKLTGFIFLMLLVILSCSDSKSKKYTEEKETKVLDLEDLLFKYEETEIKNCTELITMGDEMIDVYIETIMRAYDGNDRAKSDLLDFSVFMNKFDEEAAKISVECPEEFKEWAKKTDRRVSEVNDMLMELLNTEYYEYDKIEDSILFDLDRQLKELNEDIQNMILEDMQSENIPEE